jgi:hypothetical protein
MMKASKFNFLTLAKMPAITKLEDLFVCPEKYAQNHGCEFEGLVFDFDQTLSSIHVYHHIAKLLVDKNGHLEQNYTPDAQLALAKTWSDKQVVDLVFGGQERATRLKSFLISLKEKGHQLFVCSRGYYTVIEYLLGKLLGSTRLFTKIVANDPPIHLSQCQLPMPGKAEAIQTMIQSYLKSQSQSFVFVDDDLQGEILKVASEFSAEVIEGSALAIWVHPPQEDESGGISMELMDIIQQSIKLPSDCSPLSLATQVEEQPEAGTELFCSVDGQSTVASASPVLPAGTRAATC